MYILTGTSRARSMVLITTTKIRLTVSDPKGSIGGRWKEETKQNKKTRRKTF